MGLPKNARKRLSAQKQIRLSKNGRSCARGAAAMARVMRCATSYRALAE